MKKILLIGTGGTIASQLQHRAEALAADGALHPEAL